MYTMFTLREFPFFVRLISHATLTSTETRCLHLPQGQATRPDPARPRGKRVDIQKNLLVCWGDEGDEGCLPGYEDRIG